MEVTIKLGLDRAAFESGPHLHQIKLRNGVSEVVVLVDCDMFADTDEFFDVFVLPQISVAIEKLAAA
jgi:hypothetical protein